MDDPGTIRVRVPANVLLAGEYAVLEEGGLGLCLAVDVHARGELQSVANGAPGLVIRGSAGEQEFSYPGGNPLLNGIVSVVAEHADRKSGTMRISTDEFFRSGGAKRGFGSSAATAVAIAALWLGPAANRTTVAQVATAAHRAGQNGRGSGYDTWASVMGGLLLFSGGAVPEGRRVEAGWLESVSLFPGPNPVKTPGSVAKYEAWKQAHREDAAEFLHASNGAVRALAAAAAVDEAMVALSRCALIGRELGAAIGVPADIAPPQAMARALLHQESYKAVGAGNELGVAFVRPGSSVETLRMDGEGVVWE